MPNLDWHAPATLLRADEASDARSGLHWFSPIITGTLAEVVAFHISSAEGERSRDRLIITKRASLDGARIAELADRADFPGRLRF